jgi:hypothetical protein
MPKSDEVIEEAGRLGFQGTLLVTDAIRRTSFSQHHLPYAAIHSMHTTTDKTNNYCNWGNGGRLNSGKASVPEGIWLWCWHHMERFNLDKKGQRGQPGTDFECSLDQFGHQCQVTLSCSIFHTCKL